MTGPDRGLVPDETPAGEAGAASSAFLRGDVERLHRTVLREQSDPQEGREPMPWWFVATIVLALFWGGWYLGRYGGEFGTRTHLAFGGGREAGIAGAAAGAMSAATANPVEQGERLFLNNCQGCHQQNGRGVPGAFPPLVGSEWVTGRPETLVRILLNGLHGPVQVAGATYNGAMPAWKDVLKDEEIAAVATYLRQWSPNAAPAVGVADVAALRAALAARPAPWTEEELKAQEGQGPAPAASPAASSTAAPTASPAAAPAGGRP